MLKYLILSTPRCGSSSLMTAAELLVGPGGFVREPLNPYEREDFLPKALRGVSVGARADLLCSSTASVVGVKHVFSPFNRAVCDADGVAALERLLAVPQLKVILLSRRNLRAQFLSMEIALQSGDWWSMGAQALPPTLEFVAAGGPRPLSDAEVLFRIDRLGEATVLLRDLCQRSGVDFIDRVYEDVFDRPVDEALENVLALMAYFDPVAPLVIAPDRLRALIERGRRFEAILPIYAEAGRRYASLRN